MLWFILSLAAALTTSTNDVLAKGFFSDPRPYDMALVKILYALPYLSLGLFFVPWPQLDLTFWLCVALSLPLEVLALLTYMRAIKVSPLSLTVPFLSFTPAFVILTGYLLLLNLGHISPQPFMAIHPRLSGWGILAFSRKTERPSFQCSLWRHFLRGRKNQGANFGRIHHDGRGMPHRISWLMSWSGGDVDMSFPSAV